MFRFNKELTEEERETCRKKRSELQLDSRASDEVTDAIVREFSRHVTFLGAFFCRADSGYAEVTWHAEDEGGSFLWFLAEYEKNGRPKKKLIITYDEELAADVDGMKILERGEVGISAEGLWEIPRCIAGDPEFYELVIVGRGGYAEILPAKEYFGAASTYNRTAREYKKASRAVRVKMNKSLYKK